MNMNSGPPPKDPQKRVRTNKPPTSAVLLPPGGYQGEIPDWPDAAPHASDVVLDTWEMLWRTPQAAIWARQGLGVQLELAQYVKYYVEGTGSAAALERRQLADRLGLNPLAMRRLGWEVAPEIAVAEPVTPVEAQERYKGLRAVART